MSLFKLKNEFYIPRLNNGDVIRLMFTHTKLITKLHE